MLYLSTHEHLPFLNLPGDFCTMLKDYRPDVAASKRLDLFVQRRPFMQKLIALHMSDVDKSGRVEVLIKSLGLSGFRDRLAVIYLSYLAHGDYFHNNNLLIKDVLVFEDKLRSFTFDGHSRPFILAIYLKSLAIKQQVPMMQLFPAHLFGYLKYLQVKVQGIDWPFLLLWHFDQFLGEKKLTALLAQHSSFQYIWSLLEDQQKNSVLQSLISYALSINDKDLFYRHVGGIKSQSGNSL